jgi:hypothetical protein
VCRKLPEQDVLDIEADLLSLALGEARPSSWDLIAAVLPELRGTINGRLTIKYLAKPIVL